MENTIKEMVREATKLYGTRITSDFKCIYCNADIAGTYCQCVESQKVNRAAKRINNKNAHYLTLQELNRNADYAKNSNVPLKYADATLEHYKCRNFEEVKVFEAVKKYQEELIKNYIMGHNLLLIGNFGTAKSLLKSALCNFCTIEKKLTAKYINVTELADEVISTFSDGSPMTTYDVIRNYVAYDFLFIDDLDKLDPTTFKKNLMYKIINGRYEELKPTVISSNVDVEELDRSFLGEATISRLVENGELVYFNAANERMASL